MRQRESTEASSHIMRHALDCLSPKKQSKPVKNMQCRLKRLCSRLSASDDSGTNESLSVEQFLRAVGHHIHLH